MIRRGRKIKLKHPVLLAAWPGMGSVAYQTASYLVNKLGAKEFARIPSFQYYFPTEVRATKSIIQRPALPQNKLYYWSSPELPHDLLIFLGDAQPEPSRQYEFAKFVSAIAEKMNVELIYTFAGMLIKEERQEDLRVWAVATHAKLLKELEQHNVKPMGEARISGLNGLLLGAAKAKDIPGVCLLGELPFFAIQIEYPPSCAAILRTLKELLHLEIELEDVEKVAEEFKAQIQRIIYHLKGIQKGEESQDFPPAGSQEIMKKIEQELGIKADVPQYIKDKIEMLFHQTQKDISKACELKDLLDKWELFKFYEDRFLDLFKKKNQ